jgi:hypothetical protein
MTFFSSFVIGAAAAWLPLPAIDAMGLSPVRNRLRSGSPRNDLTFYEGSDPPLTPN